MGRKSCSDPSEFSDDDDDEAFRSENEARRRLNAYKIKRLKHNHPDSRYVSFGRESFTPKAWKRLGFYVARNDHVECVSLRNCNLDDANMSVFFQGASVAGKSRTKVLTLYSNSFGSMGMRGLMPFLKNAYGLTSLNISGNEIGTEGFWWLIKGLDGGSIEKLNLRHCGLANISILGKCSLSNLQVLYLSDNDNIGSGGCRSVAEFLCHGGCRMKKLYINRCNIGDEGAKTIAEYLVNNTLLTHLELESNSIGENGCSALLRLVADVSSVKSMHGSNHHLRLIGLKGNTISSSSCYHDIGDVIKINRYCGGNITDAGRAKVIKYHLNSDVRARLSALQGVGDYFMRPFADMDSVVLPDILALVGQISGLSDSYRLLLARNSELGFGTYGRENRILRGKILELEAVVTEQGRQIAALTARNLDLRTRLASIHHLARRTQSGGLDEEEGNGSGTMHEDG